jgi:dihydroorotase-like cyclic amidohydrolase
MISTDHSPSAPEMKLLEEGDFLKAWGGISSLQVGVQCKSCLDVSSLVQSFH